MTQVVMRQSRTVGTPRCGVPSSLDIFRVAQVSKPAVPPTSKSATRLQVCKPATQQTWKSALRLTPERARPRAQNLSIRFFLIVLLVLALPDWARAQIVAQDKASNYTSGWSN